MPSGASKTRNGASAGTSRPPRPSWLGEGHGVGPGPPSVQLVARSLGPVSPYPPPPGRSSRTTSSGLQGDAGLRRDTLSPLTLKLPAAPGLAAEDALRRLGQPARDGVELPLAGWCRPRTRWSGRAHRSARRRRPNRGATTSREPDRRRGLDHFDRHGGDTPVGYEQASRPGLLGPGADATGVGEHRRDERAAVVVVAADLHGPHGARTLGHGVVGTDLGERLEQRVRQEHARPRDGRCTAAASTALTIEPSGAIISIGAEAAVVVRDVGVEHRPHREGGVGVRVVLDDVDAPRGWRRPIRCSRR